MSVKIESLALYLTSESIRKPAEACGPCCTESTRSESFCDSNDTGSVCADVICGDRQMAIINSAVRQ